MIGHIQLYGEYIDLGYRMQKLKTIYLSLLELSVLIIK